MASAMSSRARAVALWSNFFCHNVGSISARMLGVNNEQYCSTIGTSPMGNDRSRRVRVAWFDRGLGACAGWLLWRSRLRRLSLFVPLRLSRLPAVLSPSLRVLFVRLASDL